MGAIASILAVAVVTQLADARASLAAIAGAEPLLVALAIGALALSMVVRTERWRAILPRGERPVRTAELLPLLLIGYAANSLLPLRAGDAGRAVLAAKRFRLGLPESVGAVALERMIDGFALAVLILAASLFFALPDWLLQGSLLVAVGAVAIFVTVLITARMTTAWASRKLLRLAAGLRSNNRGVALALGWSLIAWVTDGVTFWLCAMALGLDLHPLAAFLVAAGASLGGIAPSAPAALGTFELGGMAAGIALGMSGTDALALVILAHAATVIPILVAAGGFAIFARMSLVDPGRGGDIVADAPGHPARTRSSTVVDRGGGTPVE